MTEKQNKQMISFQNQINASEASVQAQISCFLGITPNFQIKFQKGRTASFHFPQLHARLRS